MVIKAQSLNPSEEKSLGLREKGRHEGVCLFFLLVESTKCVCVFFFYLHHLWEYVCTSKKLSSTNKPTNIQILCLSMCMKDTQAKRDLYSGSAVADVLVVCFTVYLGNSRVERVPSGLMRWMANFPLWLCERVRWAWTCSRELTYSGRPQQASTLLLNTSLFTMSLQVWQVEGGLVNVVWLQKRTHTTAPCYKSTRPSQLQAERGWHLSGWAGLQNSKCS